MRQSWHAGVHQVAMMGLRCTLVNFCTLVNICTLVNFRSSSSFPPHRARAHKPKHTGTRLQKCLAHETPPPVGPYSSPMPRHMVILGGWRFLMSEVPLYWNKAREPASRMCRGSPLQVSRPRGRPSAATRPPSRHVPRSTRPSSTLEGVRHTRVNVRHTQESVGHTQVRMRHTRATLTPSIFDPGCATHLSECPTHPPPCSTHPSEC